MSDLFNFHRCVSSLDTGTGYCLSCLSFTSVSFHWVPGCPRHLPLVFVTRQMKPVVERDSIQEHPILSTGTQMFSGGIFWRKISEENYIKLLLATEKTNFLDFWTITEHKKGLACWIIGGFFENWGWSHLHLDHIAHSHKVTLLVSQLDVWVVPRGHSAPRAVQGRPPPSTLSSRQIRIHFALADTVDTWQRHLITWYHLPDITMWRGHT